MKKIVFFIIPFLLYCLLRIYVNGPITGQEANEGYSAFAAINGDFGSYRQTTSNFFITYLRVPFIAVFGLNNLGVRLPSILSGGVLLLLLTFYLKNLQSYFPYSHEGKLWQRLKILIILGFVCSAGIIQANLFDLSDTVASTLIVLGLVLLNKTPKISLIVLIVAAFASFYSIPIVLFILVCYGKVLGFGSNLIFSALFLIMSVIINLLINPSYLKSVTEHSLLRELNPSEYTWQIDRRLAYDQVEGSPLATPKFNFNRFIHNKYTYGLNNFFYFSAGSIDLDKINSPFQKPPAQGNFNPTNQRLPDVFFFEIPIIFIGLIKLLQERSKLIFVGVAGMLPIILFNSRQPFIYLNLFFLICLAVGLITVAENLSGKLRTVGLTVLLLLFLTAEVSFQDLLRFHQSEWMAESDFRQFQIWNFIKDSGKNYSEIHITDRLGDPRIYFLYYNKLTPLPANKELKKYFFSSFKYLESDRKPSQLWMGIAGEFVGKFNKYKGVEQISDGKILAKIPGVKQADQFLGDEIWIVETVFDHEKK